MNPLGFEIAIAGLQVDRCLVESLTYPERKYVNDEDMCVCVWDQVDAPRNGVTI